MKKNKIIDFLNNTNSDDIKEIFIEEGLKRDYIAVVYYDDRLKRYRKKDAIYGHE